MNGINQSTLRPSFPTIGGIQNSIAASQSFADHSIGDSELNMPRSQQDFTLAERPLVLNLFHLVLNNEENYKIKLAIKSALSSPDCDPCIKRTIFWNIMNIEKHIQSERRKRSETLVDMHYLQVINELLDEMRKSGTRIILDGTDFSHVNLKNLDLSNASVVSAKFCFMKMEHVVWNNVDFSAARFSSAVIFDCHFIHADFSMAVFMQCSLTQGIINNVTLFNTRFYEMNFDHVLVPQLKSDDPQLREKIMQSEVCDLALISREAAISELPETEFVDRSRRNEMNFAKDKFAHLINFKHTSIEAQDSSISILRTSLAVREAIPQFPVYVAELISQYACEDSAWAEQPLKTNFRSVIDSEENQTIKSAIKKALISRDCDPKIKRIIFKNIMEFGKQLKNIVTASSNLSDQEKLGENSYIQVINALLTEIRDSKNLIILDNVDFTGINLAHLNLTGASAVSAKFNSMQMEFVLWIGANFKGAQFINTNILRCRFKNSVFNKSIHDRAHIRFSEFTHAEMNGVEFQRVKFDGVLVNSLKTDDPGLRKIIIEHEITLRGLLKTYSNLNSLKKSESAVLIFQYAKEERTDTVNFLACEFSTERPAPKNSEKSGLFSFLGS